MVMISLCFVSDAFCYTDIVFTFTSFVSTMVWSLNDMSVMRVIVKSTIVLRGFVLHNLIKGMLRYLIYLDCCLQCCFQSP